MRELRGVAYLKIEKNRAKNRALGNFTGRSRREREETCYMDMALERWSCRESNVVSVE